MDFERRLILIVYKIFFALTAINSEENKLKELLWLKQNFNNFFYSTNTQNSRYPSQNELNFHLKIKV